jgi:hypothetical protein
MHLSKVLLPLPLGPKITFTSPSLTSNEMPFRTSSVSNDFQTSITCKTGEVIVSHLLIQVFSISLS